MLLAKATTLAFYRNKTATTLVKSEAVRVLTPDVVE